MSNNQRRLDNPILQRFPTNQREWVQYQNEANKIESGSWTPAFVGFSADPSGTCYWERFGNIVLLRLAFTTGTSNDTTFQITNLPAFLTAPNTWTIPLGGFVDGGSNVATLGGATISAPGATTITFGLGTSYYGGGFTASSTKGFSSASGTAFMYPISHSVNI